MGVRIFCNEKEILDIKNSIFYSLHQRILSIIEEENLKINSDLEKMLEKMDQDIYGPGGIFVDISNFIKNEKDASFFAYLVNKAIKMEDKEFPFVDQVKERLRNFYEELLKYAEELKE